MPDYPSPFEIKAVLMPYLRSMTLVCTLILAAGFYVDAIGLVQNAFPRAGAVVLAISLFGFFYLEKKDYLTGHDAALFDSDGHVQARKIVAPFGMWLTFAGTLIWGLGDLVVPG
jgi:hypothetical protein